MKLAEILARGVKEWLNEWVSAVQDADGEVWFNLEDDVGPTFVEEGASWISNPCHSEMFEVSSDFQTAIVTRAQWEAERARIAAEDAPTWHIGTETEEWRAECQKQYEQELWDKVAQSIMIVACDNAIKVKSDKSKEDVAWWACATADAFMAERAKRLKGVK